jgi:hypothetical protein
VPSAVRVRECGRGRGAARDEAGAQRAVADEARGPSARARRRTGPRGARRRARVRGTDGGGREHGDAGGHRLDDGEAEALPEARVREARRAAQERRDAAVVGAVLPPRAGRGGERGDDVVVEPAARAGDDEVGVEPAGDGDAVRGRRRTRFLRGSERAEGEDVGRTAGAGRRTVEGRAPSGTTSRGRVGAEAVRRGRPWCAATDDRRSARATSRRSSARPRRMPGV